MTTVRIPLAQIVDGESYNGITPAEALTIISEGQWVRLAKLSLQCKMSVSDILEKFVLEYTDELDNVYLEGLLPHCNMYGCIDKEGRTHT